MNGNNKISFYLYLFTHLYPYLYLYRLVIWELWRKKDRRKAKEEDKNRVLVLLRSTCCLVSGWRRIETPHWEQQRVCVLRGRVIAYSHWKHKKN